MPPEMESGDIGQNVDRGVPEEDGPAREGTRATGREHKGAVASDARACKHQRIGDRGREGVDERCAVRHEHGAATECAGIVDDDGALRDPGLPGSGARRRQDGARCRTS